jgi:hypothetical protein
MQRAMRDRARGFRRAAHFIVMVGGGRPSTPFAARKRSRGSSASADDDGAKTDWLGSTNMAGSPQLDIQEWAALWLQPV